MSAADDYNRRQIEAGNLTAELVTELVRDWQRDHGLEPDGLAGPRTLAALEAEMYARATPPKMPFPRCYPLRMLADARRPAVTSRFKSRNPERPTHNGVDLFYRYEPGKDPPMRDGDGGRAGRWWIPDDTMAIAVADGVVSLAGASRTGYRVWLDVGRAWSVGYFHLSELVVRAGERVTMGQPIGIVGDNPIDIDARHLHFEIYFGELDRYPHGCRDPEVFLEGCGVLPPG